MAKRPFESRTQMAGDGRFPPDAVQYECSIWSLGESTVHDPEPTFMALALLLPIGQIADIDRERHDDSR